MYTFDGKAYNCPFDCFIDIIKGKWRTSILLALADGPVFFAKLQRCLPGISAKVLTENLHVFERNGLVRRNVHARCRRPSNTPDRQRGKADPCHAGHQRLGRWLFLENKKRLSSCDSLSLGKR